MDDEVNEQPEQMPDVDALIRERDDALARAEQAERESFLLARGVPPDDLDYYLFRIEKEARAGDGDFRAAAGAFLRQRQTSHTTRARVDTAAPLGGGGYAPSPSETMNALIRGARK